MTVHSLSIDGCATHHDIVDDGEAAFAPNPVTLAVFDATVRKYCSLVKLDPTVVELLCDWDFIWMEEIPAGVIANFVRGVTENVDNRIRTVENVGALAEVWYCEWQAM